MNLPEECWELIFESLHHLCHLESLSLVCTSFLAVSNSVRHTLSITPQTVPYLSVILHRFHNLKKIVIPQFHGDLDSILSQISRSRLDLQSLTLCNQRTFPALGFRELGSRMKNLRELNCSITSSLKDSDLIVIGNSFPSLEEIDISYPESGHSFYFRNMYLHSTSVSSFVTDSGILALSKKLRGLRKINLSVDGIGIPTSESWFEESFQFARGLRELDLSNSSISDQLLCLIAEAGLPLKKLLLSHCCCFTLVGISTLLSKYQSLLYLDLEGANFLTDDSLILLSYFLHDLTFINLSSCSKLTNSAFFAILKNCPLLNDIEMKNTNLGVEEFSMEVVKNYRVKSLLLDGNYSLDDEFIKKVAYACPHLQVLGVSHCSGITEEGIVEIMKNCFKLRNLDFSRCGGEIKNLDIDFSFARLEVLKAQGTGIDDETLVVIGKGCYGLVHLDLEGCFYVTDRGVKELVETCRALREINLKWCSNVSIDIVAWMVFSRPSLRKIIPPSGFVPTENQRSFFLNHGCLVCDG
ncbi:F-box/LRR-repeat protein 20 [Carica papaya]|uniref:F-box/LRR-repeat protein 20 n=1 Tax=Carica papaya TaxID=3649 RepID=UPI000B8D09E7|nr:F-box/LRR-repeat protein 20 [Carica papaya]